MANTTTGLFETLVVPAATLSCRALSYTKSFPESMYWEYKGVGGRNGQTLNINIPKVVDADAVDIGGGSVSVSDATHDNATIVLDKHPSVAWTIQSWDEIRTPQDLQQLYIQPKLESLLRRINGDIAALCTAANFNVNASITAGSATFSRLHLTQAWGALAGKGVPVNDTGNMFFITHTAPYANMLADTNFYQESIVGKDVAELVQRKAVFAPTLNTIIKFDQQAYQTVTPKYTGLFFHRFALGGAVVTPPPLSQGGLGGSNIKETVIYPFKNAPTFPVQLQVESSVNSQGTLFHLHAMYGAKVVRPDHGQYMVCA